MLVDDLISKFGFPPPVLEDETPMDGFTFVVRVDPYVNINNFLLGVIDDETKTICVDVKAG